MKRLLCIVGGMNAGGAETFLMKIYRELDKSLYQMDFAVAIKNKGFYDDEIKSMGGKIFHITPKTKGLFKNFNEIKNIVRSNKYNYVLRTSQHSLSALELLAAKHGGARVRVMRSSNSRSSGGAIALLSHKLFLFMPRFFANVRIAPSTEAAKFMFGKKSINNKKAIVIHNGIDFDRFKYDEKSRIIIRKAMGIEDKFVLGHIGRFNKQKNHKFLLDVFFDFKKRVPNSILVLVGKGELEKEIREYAKQLDISNSIIFTGVRNDVGCLLSAFDFMVFPSLYEGLPNTIVEAQASGLNCLLSSSITKEVAITDKVVFIDLNSPKKEWINRITQSTNRNDSHIGEQFVRSRYDISSCVKDFIYYVFENHC